ncbi:MAG: TolC family protein [Planctomycetaceae bacterium]|nr:TolC family protein [Planctomycetaceae bacterium]
MNRNKNILFVISLLVIFQAGCQKVNDRLVRQEHAGAFSASLKSETNDVLSMKPAYGLNDCVSIALQNNLEIRISAIEEKISGLERKVAFANFLPVINLDYSETRWNRTPMTKFGGAAAATHDRAIKDVTWQMQLSVFDPQTWFLYEMYKRGEELTKIVSQYTRQTIILDVIVNYYHCLSLQEMQLALESQLSSTQGLQSEIESLYNEGLVTDWQLQQAQLNVLARQIDVNEARYAVQQAKGDLMFSLGLSPLADINLIPEQPLQMPDAPVEELVYTAMLQNPGLFISDKQIQIEKEKVKIALAGFLPKLAIFAGRTNTSDSFQVFQNFWTYGLSGTLPIFNGFANINEYKAAKERQKVAFIEREQQTLVLMLEVYKAYLNLENAKEMSVLTLKAFDTASKHFEETNEKWKEGLVVSSELLEVTAEKDNAQMDLMTSKYQLQVSIAVLNNLMGQNNSPSEALYGKQ